ncbi:MAG TPA: SEC-C metal-binding domain-containing protein, partial [Acidimicrobiales bacterium]|nr:SEC-C metal-binding domain-containing protein [Acidimicrobiales bacterium]
AQLSPTETAALGDQGEAALGPLGGGGQGDQAPLTRVPDAGLEAEEPPGADGGMGGAPPEGEKVGRNDPCWCGSGRKYKVCHGR